MVPGRIATTRIRQLDEVWTQREEKTVEEATAASTATIPMRRHGAQEEHGAAVEFLASTAAPYITGTLLRVDGALILSI